MGAFMEKYTPPTHSTNLSNLTPKLIVAKKVDFANTLRGFAALCVLVSHYFGAFWANPAGVSYLTNAPELQLPMPSYLAWLHSFPLFSWGGYGVALFFLISGFVIPFSLKKSTFLGFSANRMIRILPTYFVGFSITLLAIFLCSHYFARDWAFTFREILIHYIPGIRDLFWTRSIDGIIWTLEIEVKFYLVCAIFIIWFKKLSYKIFFIPLTLCFISFFLNSKLANLQVSNVELWRLSMTFIFVSQYLTFMFIGVAFHFLYLNKITPDKAYLLIGFNFSLFCILWWAGPYSQSLSAAWSYGFALLTFCFAFSFPLFFKSNRVFDFFANISSPLYVVHGVGGYVALRILLDLGFGIRLALTIVTILFIIVSWILHKFIEEPTQKLGKKVGNLIAQIKLTKLFFDPSKKMIFNVSYLKKLARKGSNNVIS